jgi:polysaccharide export outer membrane protein
VLGEVNKPGEYPYTQGLTIRGAVAKADGFTYRANEKRVFLKRAGEAGEQEYPMAADFAVLPGDTIRFGERYF